MLKRILLLAAVASRTASAQTFTTLASFDLANGIDGDLYGVTPFGGAYGNGTVFKVTLDGTLTTLYSFANDGDGAGPLGGLVQTTDGVFYGTTAGLTLGGGTIFKMTPSGSLTTLTPSPAMANTHTRP